MSEPAKDEAELIEQVALAILDYGVINNTISTLATSALAAIRAAGWAVVPVEPTLQMLRRGLDDAGINWREASECEQLSDEEGLRIYRAMLEAAPGVKP
jgi:hypothetical protein